MENCRRVVLSVDELNILSKDDIIQKWAEQNAYIDHIESKLESTLKSAGSDELDRIKTEMTRQKNIYLYKYNLKEQELQENLAQMQEFKELQAPTNAKIRQAFLDPAVNLIFTQLKKELDACKKAKEEVLNDRQAWSFSTESQTGKRLMARCRKLLQENEELGKVVSSGNIARLETDAALQKRLVAEMRQQEREYEAMIQEMDEEMEAMTCACTHLQQRLNDALSQKGNHKETICQTVMHIDLSKRKKNADQNVKLSSGNNDLHFRKELVSDSENVLSLQHPLKRKACDDVSEDTVPEDQRSVHSVDCAVHNLNSLSIPKQAKKESLSVISNGEFPNPPK